MRVGGRPRPRNGSLGPEDDRDRPRRQRRDERARRGGRRDVAEVDGRAAAGVIVPDRLVRRRRPGPVMRRAVGPGERRRHRRRRRSEERLQQQNVERDRSDDGAGGQGFGGLSLIEVFADGGRPASTADKQHCDATGRARRSTRATLRAQPSSARPCRISRWARCPAPPSTIGAVASALKPALGARPPHPERAGQAGGGGTGRGLAGLADRADDALFEEERRAKFQGLSSPG